MEGLLQEQKGQYLVDANLAAEATGKTVFKLSGA